MIKPVPHLSAISAYPLAALKTQGAGRPLVSLAQNESACPASPAALSAATAALAEARLYPDPDWTDLRGAVAEVHGLNPDHIICAAGSMDLIGAIARCYLSPASRALTTEYGYFYFRTATWLTGAGLDLAPERAFTVDPDAILRHLTRDTNVVFIANPGNPTGTVIGAEEIVALREAIPSNVLLVLDEAYSEFADASDARLFDLVERGDTVVLRTFSKAYGLAGLRVGWGLFPPAVHADLRKLILPNNLSAPTLAAATAAMRDQAHMRDTVAVISRRRDRLAARLRAAGLAVPVSHTNFVLIGFPSADSAADADTMLRAEGYALRGVANYGLSQCLRATIGREEDMESVVQILEEFCKSHG